MAIDPESWHRIEAVLDDALELAAIERPAFLDRACDGDPQIRAEVEALLEADDQASDFLTPSDRESAVALLQTSGLEGRTVGPYRLLRRIGAGGMGVVYEAEDSRLERRVALKFLPREYSRHPAAKERFVREARAVSALDHSAICTIHDLGESDDGRLYYVMSYYRGETLEERLTRGSLPVAEAREIAIQVARGLAHAHAAGITHRDIKPANVILIADETGSDRSWPGLAKILDFGVARVEAATALTRTGTSLGTPAYMSPEQSRGEPADARSDLWSLGVLLYEMLSGRRPFDGDNALSVMNAIVTRAPEPLLELRPEVPAALAATVAKLLAKDPADRYTSAGELLADLGAETGPARAPTGSPPARGWRPLLAGLVAGLLLLIGLLAIPASRQALLRPLTRPGNGDPRLVAVLPLVNGMGTTPENQALAAGLTYSLTGLVARLGAAEDSLWVVPAEEIVQRKVTTSVEARRIFGADAVLTGNVQKLGAATEIVLNLIDPSAEPPRILDSQTVAAPLSSALRDVVLDQLADLLRVGEASRSRLRSAGGAMAQPAVYTLYLQGLGYLQTYDREGHLDAAVQAFRDALELDPEYGPAYAGLCEALWDVYRQTSEPDLAEDADASCDRAAELAAGQVSVLVSVAKSYYQQGEIRKARAELDRALELEPERAESHRWSSWVASREGRPQAAEEALRTAIALEPGLWVYYQELGITLNDQGRYREAAELFEQALRLTPENHLVYNALGVARAALHEVDEAERLYRRSIELHPTPLAHRNLGLLYFREQLYDRAVSELEKARDLHRRSPSFNDWIVWSWLAHAYYWAGDKPAAETAWRRLIELATPLYEVNPKDSDVLLLLTEAHVALGDLERGRYFRDRLLAQPIGMVYTRYYLGRIYEMMGDRELALDYVTQALDEGFDSLEADRDPWLEDLRKEPRYRSQRRQ